jgi:hypothetical protein
VLDLGPIVNLGLSIPPQTEGQHRGRGSRTRLQSRWWLSQDARSISIVPSLFATAPSSQLQRSTSSRPSVGTRSRYGCYLALEGNAVMSWPTKAKSGPPARPTLRYIHSVAGRSDISWCRRYRRTLTRGYRPDLAPPEWRGALESMAETAGSELAALTDATGALVVAGGGSERTVPVPNGIRTHP